MQIPGPQLSHHQITPENKITLEKLLVLPSPDLLCAHPNFSFIEFAASGYRLCVSLLCHGWPGMAHIRDVFFPLFPLRAILPTPHGSLHRNSCKGLDIRTAGKRRAAWLALMLMQKLSFGCAERGLQVAPSSFCFELY